MTDHDDLIRRGRESGGIGADLSPGCAVCEELTKALEAASRNERRYLWLRDEWYIKGRDFPIPVDESDDVTSASHFDDRIDAALASETRSGEDGK